MTSSTVTSMYVGRGSQFLNIMDGARYMVGRDTLIPLVAGQPYENIMVNMAGRAPVAIRQQPNARPITLVVFLLEKTGSARAAAYTSLVTYLDSTDGLVQLRWLDGATWKRYWCLVTNIQPTAWYQRVGAELVAPNPVAEVFTP